MLLASSCIEWLYWFHLVLMPYAGHNGRTHTTNTLLLVLLQASSPCYFFGRLSECLLHVSKSKTQRQAWLVGVQQTANAIVADICFDSMHWGGPCKSHYWHVLSHVLSANLCCQCNSCSGLYTPKVPFPWPCAPSLVATYRCALTQRVIHVSGVTNPTSNTLLVIMPAEQDGDS